MMHDERLGNVATYSQKNAGRIGWPTNAWNDEAPLGPSRNISLKRQTRDMRLQIFYIGTLWSSVERNPDSSVNPYPDFHM
jgi:hypothetical protein